MGWRVVSTCKCALDRQGRCAVVGRCAALQTHKSMRGTAAMSISLFRENWLKRVS